MTSNERHQFGFRLAQEMGLKELFAVDWNDNVDGVPDLGVWAEENTSSIFDDVIEKGKQLTLEYEDYFKNHTIKEYLLLLNDKENVKSNHEVYIKLALMGTQSNPADLCG
ncbi:DUF5694 domain-containing protein [Virgibacillus sp. CBA3643]|uniref:DUF5694 domain-containing protein n=1 Tax=Virgibacillus sp. CBA3643 TaxID=2942278 RepID=UPI0035A2D1C8